MSSKWDKIGYPEPTRAIITHWNKIKTASFKDTLFVVMYTNCRNPIKGEKVHIILEQHIVQIWLIREGSQGTHSQWHTRSCGISCKLMFSSGQLVDQKSNIVSTYYKYFIFIFPQTLTINASLPRRLLMLWFITSCLAVSCCWQINPGPDQNWYNLWFADHFRCLVCPGIMFWVRVKIPFHLIAN